MTLCSNCNGTGRKRFSGRKFVLCPICKGSCLDPRTAPQRPPETRSRITDPATSKLAAAKLPEDMADRYRVIYEVVRTLGPISDEDMIASLELFDISMSTSGARTRRSEMVDAGWVRDSGKRGTTSNGGECTLWECVPPGERSQP